MKLFNLKVWTLQKFSSRMDKSCECIGGNCEYWSGGYDDWLSNLNKVYKFLNVSYIKLWPNLYYLNNF